MTTHTEKEIEMAYHKARNDHEQGMSPELIELDRRGDWLHRNWFTLGFKQGQEHLLKEMSANSFEEWLSSTNPSYIDGWFEKNAAKRAWQAAVSLLIPVIEKQGEIITELSSVAEVHLDHTFDKINEVEKMLKKAVGE